MGSRTDAARHHNAPCGLFEWVVLVTSNEFGILLIRGIKGKGRILCFPSRLTTLDPAIGAVFLLRPQLHRLSLIFVLIGNNRNKNGQAWGSLHDRKPVGPCSAPLAPSLALIPILILEPRTPVAFAFRFSIYAFTPPGASNTGPGFNRGPGAAPGGVASKNG